ncbi:helix-turn-helix transcriptional regulator [Pararhizobium sp. IMCC21322]|uniref:ArsR/SmtB family transcription factor n=1 Tax=Pararhizobium sp. IMCC21322 TaxID=3067903 RepID=UPI00274203D8|nr:metalloregulator ArsR/SmtB family transcription factor [Pararhizobium sp. IMCC21322]
MKQTAPSAEVSHGENAAGGVAGDCDMAVVLRALGHPARLEIIRALASKGRCFCGEIVEMLPLVQSTVSQHLKVLKDAGLIVGTIDGPRSCYCLNTQKLKHASSLIADLTASGEAVAPKEDNKELA